MRVVVWATVRAPLEQVWRWWTDYGPPGVPVTVGHGLARSKRVVRGREGNRIRIDEHADLLGLKGPRVVEHEVEIHPEDHTLTERILRPLPSESRWTFRQTSDGTVVTRTLEIPSWWGRLSPPAPARWLARADLRHHARQAERELQGF